MCTPTRIESKCFSAFCAWMWVRDLLRGSSFTRETSSSIRAIFITIIIRCSIEIPVRIQAVYEFRKRIEPFYLVGTRVYSVNSRLHTVLYTVYRKQLIYNYETDLGASLRAEPHAFLLYVVRNRRVIVSIDVRQPGNSKNVLVSTSAFLPLRRVEFFTVFRKHLFNVINCTAVVQRLERVEYVRGIEI